MGGQKDNPQPKETDPFVAWLRALAAEIDRRYREEGRAPCR